MYLVTSIIPNNLCHFSSFIPHIHGKPLTVGPQKPCAGHQKKPFNRRVIYMMTSIYIEMQNPVSRRFTQIWRCGGDGEGSFVVMWIVHRPQMYADKYKLHALHPSAEFCGNLRDTKPSRRYRPAFACIYQRISAGRKIARNGWANQINAAIKKTADQRVCDRQW